MDQLEYVESQVATNTTFYTVRRNSNRRAAFWFALLPAALSAAATVFVGVSTSYSAKWASILAMVVSGIASVLGAWQALFANRRLWVLNNLTLAALHELACDIEFRKADPARPTLTPAEIEEFYLRSKKISRDAEEALATARSA